VTSDEYGLEPGARSGIREPGACSPEPNRDAMPYTLTISGMSCDHCVRRVTEALSAVPGVTVKEVVVGRAVVEDHGDPAKRAAVLRAVDDAGYAAEVSG
jgi:copper chaperone